MTSEESKLSVTIEEDVTRVHFLDRNILDEERICQIGDEIGQLIDQVPMPKILLNFENVEHLSSAALGMLITVNNRIHKKGGQLRLASIDPQIQEVFVITKLDQLFQIHESAGEAVASFK